MGFYVAGSPEGSARGYATDARIVLVPAVALLLWAARRGRTATSVRAVRVIAVALVVVAVRAAGEGQVVGAATGLLAALLLISVIRQGGSEHPPAAQPMTTAQPTTSRPGYSASF